MQYKIPVQIENEDPIVLWLSLRQLVILMIWWWIAYWTFNSLAPNVWEEIALIPTIIFFWITLLIVLFKKDEMTFFPFILALLRFNINIKERSWWKWIDNFSPLDVWIIVDYWEKKDNKIEIIDKNKQIDSLKDRLNKI